MELDLSPLSIILSCPEGSGAAFYGLPTYFGVQDIQFQRRKLLEMGAGITAPPPCFDPEVSGTFVIRGVSVVTQLVEKEYF